MSHPAGCHCQGPLDTCCSKDHDPDPAGGRRVDVLIEDFCRRTGQPRAEVKDAAYNYLWNALRETLHRLDVILEDNEIPQSRRDKIIRQMLYGSPSEGEADLRIDIMDHTRSFLEEQIKMPPDKVP